MTIQFGTEGWRAVIAEEFTVDNVRLVSQAIADHLTTRRRRRSPSTVVVGHDTRFLSDRFARAVCEVLAGNGITSVLADRAVPTCAVSRFVVDHRLPLGVMVTASHNPGVYNGLKVKEAFGGSATPETVASIERRLGHSRVKWMPCEEAQRAKRVRRANLLVPFLSGIRSFIDLSAIKRMPFRVVVDSMHGSGGRLIERLLANGRCHIETIHAEPDPLFGGQAPEPIPSRLSALRQAMRRRRASVGIANDGDADRIGVMGPGGTWYPPGQVLCVLLMHLVRTRHATGAVVKTVSNTMMIDRLAHALGLRLMEVPVGFKHIAKLMLEQDILIGGEESGGIGVKGYLPERDGILNGLLILEAMAMRGQPLSSLIEELERRCGRWCSDRRDLHLNPTQVDGLFARLTRGSPERMGSVDVVRVNTLDGVKLIGRDESWLLFRRSGTEPIVRIYAESPQPRQLARLLAFGVHLATRA